MSFNLLDHGFDTSLNSIPQDLSQLSNAPTVSDNDSVPVRSSGLLLAMTMQVLFKYLQGKFGTVAMFDVPTGGNATNSEVVIGNDTRLSDARIPLPHTQDFNTLTNVPSFAAAVHQHVSTDITDSTLIGREILTAIDGPSVRTLIGAGTSSLVIGNTAGTALSGDYVPDYNTLTNIPSSFPPSKHFHTIAGVTDLQETLDAKISTSEIGVAGGVVPLNSNTKIDATYLSESIVSGLHFSGAWDVAANSPDLTSSSCIADTSGIYIASTAGMFQNTYYSIGDWCINDAGTWIRVGATAAISTVFGRTGAVVATAGDYNLDQITDTDNYKRLTAAQFTGLTGAADTALHYHATDRNRANHTGTQTYSTISDFATGVTTYAPVKTINSLTPDAAGNIAIAKSNVGLGNVDNTTDLAKPISTATQTALNAKQDSLGFTPVQQGGGTNQSTNKIYIGWTGSNLGLQVDSTNFAATWPINVTGNSTYATKAGALNAPVTITGSGDASFSFSSDFSANATTTLTLALSGVTAGTGYNLVDVDSKGRVINASKATTLSGLGITDAIRKNANDTFSGSLDAGGTGAINRAAYFTSGSSYECLIAGFTSNSIGYTRIRGKSGSTGPYVDASYHELIIGGDGTFTFDGSNITTAANVVTQMTSTLSNYILTSAKGAASGVCPLNSSKLIDAAYLPSYVDDVLEYSGTSAFPATGETGKIYVDTTATYNNTYRWSGTQYINIALAPVTSVAGRTGAVVLTATDVGLGNCNNTSDTAKPISTATQAALDLKSNTSHTHYNIVPHTTISSGYEYSGVFCDYVSGASSGTGDAAPYVTRVFFNNGSTPSATNPAGALVVTSSGNFYGGVLLGSGWTFKRIVTAPDLLIPMPISGGLIGTQVSGTVCLNYVVGRTIVLPATMPYSALRLAVAPAAACTYTLQYAAAGSTTFTTIATFTVAAGATNATITTSNASAITLTQGMLLQVVCNTTDTTGTNMAVTIDAYYSHGLA